jgi:hypothetical protein
MARSTARVGVARAAAQRERRRGNAWLSRTAKRVGLVSLGVWVATMVIGHSQPFFAPIAAAITVTAGMGQRRRVAFDLVIGVSVGIGTGELLIGLIGRGTWPLALVVALAVLAEQIVEAEHHGTARLLAGRGGAAAVHRLVVVEVAIRAGRLEPRLAEDVPVERDRVRCVRRKELLASECRTRRNHELDRHRRLRS